MKNILLIISIFLFSCAQQRVVVKNPPLQYYKDIARFQDEYLQGKLSLDDYRYLVLGEDEIYGVKTPHPCQCIIYKEIPIDRMPLQIDDTTIVNWSKIAQDAKKETDHQFGFVIDTL